MYRMNTVAHGVDIVLCERIERMWRTHADRFLARLYTPAEQRYCLDCKYPAVRLAGRFAAKEAVLKVLGTGLRGGLEWTQIETLPDALGKPEVTLHHAAADAARSAGISRILMSISHAGEYAVASAIGVGADDVNR